MAKSSVSTFNKFLASIPNECVFSIAMVANSTTATYVDIDTEIGDGEAWAIFGLEYTFEKVDPANIAPTNSLSAVSNDMVLQLHRNDDHTALLNLDDDDLMIDHRVTVGLTTSGANIHTMPLQVPKRTITMQPTLRAIFQTAVDNAQISDAANQLTGKIFYEKIKAPNIGVSKMGLIANL